MVTKKPSIHKKKLKKLEIADTVRHELRNNTKKLKSLRETSFPLAYFWVPRHPARYYAARNIWNFQAGGMVCFFDGGAGGKVDFFGWRGKYFLVTFFSVI